MVGIDAGREFRELHTVDQFALCGISPTIKLSFQELRKQAIRVSVLLHDDFKRPAGVVPPFSSAVANDMKGWLQAQVSDEQKVRAERRFYANSTGHCGLVWQPYLKGKDGNLLPRTDPAIWQRPGYKPPVPTQVERKRRTYASTPGTREDFHRRECTAATPPPTPSPSSDDSSRPNLKDAAAFSDEDLFALAEKAGDSDRRSIAVACLPKHQDRIVTMSLDSSCQVSYIVENIDRMGNPLNSQASEVGKMTFKRLKREKHVFLGRFIGATAGNLRDFAIAMELDFFVPLSGQSRV